ncbi:DUF2510 domain-containing protein [Microbacterium sp. NPDC057659]|uniref:DUF2510 domain-containing protein n=1 Tax=Microbacterium sp. NPDC057659 TaxID=3346198 RepID=UPI00366F4876
MAAAPGWYPAGVPGRERWWDGLQWTSYERDAVASAAPVATLPQQIPMGWYSFSASGEARWWDGLNWTPYRVRNGKPGADAYAMEPAGLGWAIGGLFAVAGLLYLFIGLFEPGNLLLAALFLLLGALWMVGAGRAAARQKIPAPTTVPLLDDVLRPLPGEAEGDGAGWYPVSGRTLHRWWTGTRWAAYISDRGRVRPTQAGPRAYLSAMIVGAVVGVLALVVMTIGIVLTAGGDDVGAPILTALGVLLLFLAGVIVVSVWLRRYALILPKAAPAQK